MWKFEGVRAVCDLPFPADLPCGLVVAEAQEPGVAQQPCRGPFGEADFSHELWRYPLDIARGGQSRGERRSLPVKRHEPAVKQVEGSAIVTGAHLARVAQRLVVVVAHEQSAQTFARTL